MKKHLSYIFKSPPLTNCNPRSASLSLHSSCDGFALTSFLIMIPFILLLMMCTLLFTGFLTFDQSLKKVCREELWKLQDRDQKKIQKILALNPLAQKLKSEHNLLLLRLAQATALGRVEMMAYLSAQITRVQRHRARLDQVQKLILESSRRDRNLDVLRLRSRLLKTAKFLERSPYFETKLLLSTQVLSPMAVRPTSPELAPSYELQVPFREQQSVYVNWKIFFQNGSHISQRLPFRWIWKRECGVTLEKVDRGDSWKKIIRADRFFWK